MLPPKMLPKRSLFAFDLGDFVGEAAGLVGDSAKLYLAFRPLSAVFITAVKGR